MPRSLLALGVLAAALAAAPGDAFAAAGTATSSNWGGYAATGRHFRTVSATWVQPAATCGDGLSSTAYWVGLGGYSAGDSALEQIGTQSDCDDHGRVSYSAWYEVVPSIAGDPKLAIHAGDRMSARVAVTGHRVSLRLSNLTTGASFSKSLRASKVDVTSAEWIVEAPSLCDQGGGCQTAALAPFGSVGFAHARAATASHSGAIADSSWKQTAITLVSRGDGPGGRGFGPGSRYAQNSAAPKATPGALSSSGDAFAVAYSAGDGAPDDTSG